MPKGKGKGRKGGGDSSQRERMPRKAYEAELARLQGELVKVQLWAQRTGFRAIVLFEGRDAAGKGGAIKRITERVSPRVFRLVALPAPTDRERSQVYTQRYMRHFPAAGEIVLFDRSWYNRAGVERVMGFCSDAELEGFFAACPFFELMIVKSGIRLIKYWFDVGMEEQERRFRDRVGDPRKVWKLSPMDVESYRRWYDYSRARDEMLEKTDVEYAPWHLVRANDKRRARLNCIAHLLDQIPYEDVPRDRVDLGKRKVKGSYDDEASIVDRRFVPEVF